MEKLKPIPKEWSAPSIEELDNQIREILYPQVTKERLKEFWKEPRFAESFPNMVCLLISPQFRDKFAQGQKQRIFELSLPSFMELPWTGGKSGAAVSAKIFRVNEQTQLWERVKTGKNQVIKPGIEALTRLEIGSLILLGLSLQDKQYAESLIAESYETMFSPKKPANSKPRTFTDNLITLTTKNNVFRQWVKTNDIDLQNGFNWDRDVTKLALHLISSGLPREARQELPKQFIPSLSLYPPEAIDELLNFSLAFVQKLSRVSTVRKDIGAFNIELLQVLKTDFCKDPSLLAQIQSKQEQVATILASAVEKK